MAEIREEPLQPQNEDLNARLARMLQFQLHHQPLKPRIQRIPRFLWRRNPKFVDYYCSPPQMISFGPIHHQLEVTNLKRGHQLKTSWANRYLEKMKMYGDENNNPIVSLYATVESNVGRMRKLFSQDVIRNYDDRKLADMLFVDGCALLFFMGTVDEKDPESLNLKLNQLMYVWTDMILLENQLPMELLELLCGERGLLPNLFYNFLFMGLTRTDRDSIFTWSNDCKPAHLLDYIRLFHTSSLSSSLPIQVKPSLLDRSICFCRTRLFKKKKTLPLRQKDPWHRYKNIRDLRNVGIRVEANTSEWKWSNISFTSKWFSGQLMLPGIVVDNVAPYLYVNMIAYEMLPSSNNNFQCCSYFFLMDSLIDDAEDVKELRLAGVLQNLLGSDEDVAKLFNALGYLLPAKMFNCTTRNGALAYNDKYIKIKHQIDKHYTNRWKTWRAQLHTTYFNNPWSIIAFLAAVLALFLTCVQTWYAVFS
ncbi:uncharacterized protein LOC130961235 isoform X1 [Arachis stenosperma]|uniref:uncharacterized protein LOC130961235 isoform X1 n=1 Tax=Arachis stenosperma TaxID=217475 RepID=UPI0025ACECCB|nr:uncharacterized protein LOC130961235 isoform X1 [Arachis stenosperma]